MISFLNFELLLIGTLNLEPISSRRLSLIILNGEDFSNGLFDRPGDGALNIFCMAHTGDNLIDESRSYLQFSRNSRLGYAGSFQGYKNFNWFHADIY